MWTVQTGVEIETFAVFGLLLLLAGLGCPGVHTTAQGIYKARSGRVR